MKKLKKTFFFETNIDICAYKYIYIIKKGGLQMEKELGQIKFTETDDGFRVDVKGQSFKEAMACGCMPMFGGAKMMKVECCSTEDVKMEECCPSEKKKENK